MKKTLFKVLAALIPCITTYTVSGQIKDVFTPLSDHSIHLHNYLENDIQNSITHWNKAVVPYDKIELQLDMRCKIIDAPRGSNRDGDNFQALIRGPIVLARDENIDPDFDKPVQIQSKNGFVELASVSGPRQSKLKFKVPITTGYIHMLDYASVDSWSGKRFVPGYPC